MSCRAQAIQTPISRSLYVVIAEWKIPRQDTNSLMYVSDLSIPLPTASLYILCLLFGIIGTPSGTEQLEVHSEGYPYSPGHLFLHMHLRKSTVS
jgi:hypothetical protein